MTNLATRHIAPAQKPKTSRLNIIILSGGIPKKLKGKGPKALTKINHEMTLLETQVRNLPLFNDYNIIDITVVSGFEHEKIRKILRNLFNIKIVYNPLFKETNVCYAVGLALENSHCGDTLIIHGDILFNKQTIDKIYEDKISKLLIDNKCRIKGQKIGVGIEAGYITNMAYSLSVKWGQIAFFTKKELKALEKIVFNHKLSSQWFLHEAIVKIINDGGKFYSFNPKKGNFIEVENREDIEKAKAIC